MDEQAKKAARQARIEMTRKFNSLIVNMTKTQTLIYDLSRAIELDERHQKEDREQAIAFIDQQIDIIKRAKDSFLMSDIIIAVFVYLSMMYCIPVAEKAENA